MVVNLSTNVPLCYERVCRAQEGYSGTQFTPIPNQQHTVFAFHRQMLLGSWVATYQCAAIWHVVQVPVGMSTEVHTCSDP